MNPDDSIDFNDMLNSFLTGPAKTEPASDMREFAAHLFGLYTALTDAGFGREQATVMITGLMTHGLLGGQ